MAITAENLAAYRSAAEDQDAMPAFPVQRANAAINAGRFQNEITPVMIPSAEGRFPLLSIPTSNPR